jgi:hypothetical protein
MRLYDCIYYYYSMVIVKYEFKFILTFLLISFFNSQYYFQRLKILILAVRYQNYYLLSFKLKCLVIRAFIIYRQW